MTSATDRAHAAFERRFAELSPPPPAGDGARLRSCSRCCLSPPRSIGNFNPSALIEGAPKLGEYVQRTLADACVGAACGADLAYWFYGLRKWLDLLLETVLMAYLATLLGSVGALLLCFFGSAQPVARTRGAITWRAAWRSSSAPSPIWCSR